MWWRRCLQLSKKNVESGDGLCAEDPSGFDVFGIWPEVQFRGQGRLLRCRDRNKVFLLRGGLNTLFIKSMFYCFTDLLLDGFSYFSNLIN